MTEAEKLVLLKSMTGETDEDVLSAYLGLAGDKVCRKAWPFDPSRTEVPDRYAGVQVEVAAHLLNKRGAEGEIMHSENGISRSYADGDVPAALLRDVLPCAAVIGGDA